VAYIAIRNWSRFQHYVDRRPPWVKLHVEILDNADLAELPPASQLVAYKMLVIASKSDNRTTENVRILAGWMQMPTRTVNAALTQLERIGFLEKRYETEHEIRMAQQGQIPLIHASGPQAERTQTASARARVTETEEQELRTQLQRQSKKPARAKPLPSDDQDLIQRICDTVADSPESAKLIRLDCAGRPAWMLARALEAVTSKQPPPRSKAAYFRKTLWALIAEHAQQPDDDF
jgi:hypothetical protein